jgi:chromosome segregation ATPase
MKNTFLLKHLAEAQAEMRELLARHDSLAAEQAQIERTIAKLLQDIAQLHEICGEVPKDSAAAKLSTNIKDWGLSDAIRVLMKAADRPLSAVDVRDRLKSIGFKVKQYQNDMATVNLTLERLHKQGELDASRTKVNGKRVYIWSPIGPNVREVILVNPPYAKPKSQRYRVKADAELVKKMMSRKRKTK